MVTGYLEQFNIKIYKPTRWEENTAILEFTDTRNSVGGTDRYANREEIINDVTGKSVSVGAKIKDDIAAKIKELAKETDKYIMIEGRASKNKPTHSFNINGLDIFGKLQKYQTSTVIAQKREL